MFRPAFLSLICGCCAFAQLSPEDSLAKIKVADGLEITLFAAEPDVWNPTTIDVDANGRVWVCEARNYRLFNQPITEKAGDRIRILEDTDGDGKCDKSSTFYQDPSLQAPMGIAVLGERVYICQAPDLFYLEDTNNDGVADKRTVILTGFEGADHDHTVHGVSFGPDGLLYFSVGDRGLDVTDKSGNRIQVGKDRPHQAASILRCDLDGDHLELLAEGMRNPYEPAVDPWGNVFVSDNDDDGNEQCRVNYVMEGGNYGYWPRRKGNRRLDAVHWNADQPGVVPTMVKTGFGSPTGLLFYQGTLLPSRYQNTLIHTDAGPRVVRSYRPEPIGAGYKAEIDILVSCEEDTWFRPSDVCAAPDGSLYVSDWYDPGVGGHRMGDVSRGRIYRVAPQGHRGEMSALDLASAEGLKAAINSPNQARRYLAFTEIGRRIAAGDNSIAADTLLEGEGGAAAARGLWAISQSSTMRSNALSLATKDKAAPSKVQAVRVLKRAGDVDGMLALAKAPDVHVRRQLLIELAHLKSDAKVAKTLIDLAVQFDGQDRFYREAIGIAFRGQESWAFNEIIARLGDQWDSRLAGLVIQLHPPDALPLAKTALALSKQVELRKLALDALDAIGTKEAGEAIISTLAADAPEELTSHALHLLARDEGDRWRGVLEKSSIANYLQSGISDAAHSSGALAFVAETRFTPALGAVTACAADPKAAAEQRIAALNTLQVLASRASRNDTAPLLKTVTALISEIDPATQAAAVRALGAFKGSDAMEALSDVLTRGDAPLELRREALHALAASKPGSNALVDLAEKRKLPDDLMLDATETLHASPHENIRLMAEKVLPRASTRDGEQLPPLSEMLAMSGDAARGREVFFNPDRAQCFRCHVVNGEGKLVGPDLSKIGQKGSKENLFESLLNPSAAVSPEYKVWILSTFEEGALSGFIRAESPEKIELVDSTGTVTTLSPNDVLERSASSASLMPNGLTAALTAQELVDVVAYLQSLK